MESNNNEVNGKLQTIIVIGSVIGCIVISEILKYLLK